MYINLSKTLYVPSTGKGKIFICPGAENLSDIHPKCQGKFWLEVGESKNNYSMTEEIIDGERYYVVLVSGTGAQESDVGYTVWDSYVDSSVPTQDTNFGLADDLLIRGGSPKQRIYRKYAG